MNFDFSEEQYQFLREVDEFLEENRHIDVMDVTRENMAQVCDTPERRAFMKKLAAKGWLGITWPKEYGGQDGEGIYEYLLNESFHPWGRPRLERAWALLARP